MSILNKNKLTTKEILERMQQAMKDGNDENVIAALEEMQNTIAQNIKNDFEEYQKTQDKSILSQRGYRQLTAAEEKFYNNLITASKCRNVQQAVTTLTELTGKELMPDTIIEDVYRDLVEKHPLLEKVNFQNVKYATKVIFNDHTQQNAVWGEIDGEITKEITSAFRVMDITQNKLSAFALVPMGLLDLGPTFLDGYIRTILRDAIACGLEEAIVKGDGNGKPIGLMKKLTGALDGVHQDKEAISVTEFTVKTMGGLIAKMAKTDKNHNRVVNNLALICNSNDYYTLVAPAVRVQNMSGAYVDNFPYPIDIVISEFVPTGKAILTMLANYFVGVGFPKDGVIEFSTEYKFLEDQKTYKIKTYGTGRAIDENSALVLDISGLEPAVIAVKQK